MMYKTETDTQTQKTKLMVTKGKRAWGRDKLGVLDQQIQNTAYKIGEKQNPTVWHRKLFNIL